MPTKLGKGGSGQQNYVPKGNGDASGEYGDNATGSNVHYFAHFEKQPTMEMTGKDKEAKLVDKTVDDENLSDEDLFDKEDDDTVEWSSVQIKPIKKTYEKKVQLFDDTDCYDYLLGFEGEFDEEKLKKLNSQQLHDLVLAKMNVETKDKKDVDSSFIKELKKINDDYAIWKEIPKNLEDAKISFEKKKTFFQNLINDPIITDNIKNHSLEKINALDNFNFEKWEKEQEKQNKLKELKKSSEELLSNYYNPDNVYSQKAKDNAIWYKSDAKNKASKYFETTQQDAWDSLTENEAKTIYGYTKSFSSINEPLRKIKYGNYGSYSEEFIDKVKNMTSAIDKCVLKDNMWVQRGVGKLNINGTNIGYGSDISNLEGVVFEDQGFVSCGAGKGTGFSGNVIMNIYCPKGTKGIYVGSTKYDNKYVGNLSHFAGSNENELILQRGYSYKITKTEKKNGQIYLDCEVILNSDSKKYNDKQLQEIKEKYFV